MGHLFEKYFLSNQMLGSGRNKIQKDEKESKNEKYMENQEIIHTNEDYNSKDNHKNGLPLEYSNGELNIDNKEPKIETKRFIMYIPHDVEIKFEIIVKDLKNYQKEKLNKFKNELKSLVDMKINKKDEDFNSSLKNENIVGTPKIWNKSIYSIKEEIYQLLKTDLKKKESEHKNIQKQLFFQKISKKKSLDIMTQIAYTRFNIQEKIDGIKAKKLKYGIDSYKIGVFSTIGTGKSSLLNSIFISIGEKQCFTTGYSNTEHITKKIEKKSIGNIQFIDTFGWNSFNSNFKGDTFRYILNGNIKPGFEMIYENVKCGHHKNTKAYSLVEDYIHCPIFLIDIDTITNPNQLLRLKEYYDISLSHYMKPLVVITKIDKIDPVYQFNLNGIEDDERTKYFINEIHNNVNVPLDYIFLISNFSLDESENIKKQVFALNILEKAIESCESIMEFFKYQSIVKIE